MPLTSKKQIMARDFHELVRERLTQRVASLESDLERERSAKYDVELDYRKMSEQLNKAQADYRKVSEDLNKMLMEGRPPNDDSASERRAA